MATGKPLTEIGPAVAFAFTAFTDGQVGVAIRSGFNKLEVFDLSVNQPPDQPTPLGDLDLAFVADPVLNVDTIHGRKLILEYDGQLRMLDVESGETGERASTVLAETSAITALTFMTSTNGIPYLVAIISSGCRFGMRGENRR